MKDYFKNFLDGWKKEKEIHQLFYKLDEDNCQKFYDKMENHLNNPELSYKLGSMYYVMTHKNTISNNVKEKIKTLAEDKLELMKIGNVLHKWHDEDYKQKTTIQPISSL